jgi:hypothetical protein
MLVKCPNCGKQLNVPDTAAGKKAKCPGCANIFEVMASSAVAAAPPAPKPPPPPIREDVEEDRPRRRVRDEEDEDDRPRRRPRDEEDDDDRPRRRSRDEDDEDEDFDDQPRSRSRSGSGSSNGSITSVGIISIVLGSLITLGSLCVLLGGIFVAAAANDIKNMPNVQNANAGVGLLALGGFIVILIGIAVLLLGVGQIMGGVGILRRRQWGRILILVIGGFYILFALNAVWSIIQLLGLPAFVPKTMPLLTQLLFLIVEVGYVISAYLVLLNRRNASQFR